MTNQNYTQMTNQDLVEFVLSLNKRPDILNRHLQVKYSDIYKEIEYRTSFLNQYFNERNKQVPIFARLYCLQNNIKVHPMCQKEHCSNKVGWNQKTKEFLHHCSRKCSNTDPISDAKRCSTNIQKRGVPFSVQSKEVREKALNTMSNRYGVFYALQNNQLLQTFKNTCLNKYGGVGFGASSIMEKYKNTMLHTYGYDNAMSVPQIKEHHQQSLFNSYGVTNPSLSEEIHLRKQYTNLQRRGVPYPTQSDEVKQKYRNTCNTKWGVSNYSQTPEFHRKCHKPYTNTKYPGMTFGSSLEFKVYDFLTENNIEFEYQPSISYEYEYDCITWTYHPDFLVNGKVYEVKGDMFFRVNESTGKEEMFCPWGRKKLGEEKWNWLCGKYEAKHQCMLKNDVIILRHEQIQNLFEVFTSQIL